MTFIDLLTKPEYFSTLLASLINLVSDDLTLLEIEDLNYVDDIKVNVCPMLEELSMRVCKGMQVYIVFRRGVLEFRGGGGMEAWFINNIEL